MRCLKLTIAYDGTSYAGWQVQPGQTTIQSTLEAAWEKVTGERLRATASGRTDAGVHAVGQVVGISTDSELSCDRVLRALNGNTPFDIVVRSVEEAWDGFHAIRDAIGKRYRYVIQDGPLRDVFARRYAWHVVPRPLDVGAMQAAARLLLGEHDFASFEASGSDRATSVRNVYDLQLLRTNVDGFDRLVLEIEADGFLYNMVRNIVGTLVEVGRGARRPEWVGDVLRARDRRAAGPTAPPHGLFLLRVDYPPTKPGVA